MRYRLMFAVMGAWACLWIRHRPAMRRAERDEYAPDRDEDSSTTSAQAGAARRALTEESSNWGRAFTIRTT